MSSMRRWVSAQEGLTLVETMLSMAILAMALAMIMGVLWTSQSDSRAAAKWGDQAQQLRMAMNMLGQDISFATTDGDPKNLGWCCSGGGSEFTVAVYHPKASTTGWHPYWTQTERWPGMMNSARTLLVTYRIEGGALIRVVREPVYLSGGGLSSTSGKEYHRQEVLSNVDASGSGFTVDGTKHLITARLRTVEGEGVPSAETSAQWHVRKMRRR